MKSLFIVILLAVSLQTSIAMAGAETRGGGTIEASEFSKRATAIVFRMEKFPSFAVEGQNFYSRDFSYALSVVKVFAVEHRLKLNGRSVDAINDLQAKTITFNASRWRKFTTEAKNRLIVHELLALTYPKISDLNYVYSNGILAKIPSGYTNLVRIDCSLFDYLDGQPMTLKHIAKETIYATENEVTPFSIATFLGTVDFQLAHLKMSLRTAEGRFLYSAEQDLKEGNSILAIKVPWTGDPNPLRILSMSCALETSTK